MFLVGLLACVAEEPEALVLAEEPAESCPSDPWGELAHEPDALFRTIRSTAVDMELVLSSPESMVTVTASLVADGAVLADSAPVYAVLSEWSPETCEGSVQIRLFAADPETTCAFAGRTADLHVEVTALDTGVVWAFVEPVSIAIDRSTEHYCA